ncbi:hypothetical protein [Microbispora sp. GKU 823]|uniref:hypothetical protein n=1 Tax=Microbispora sp. GKU 823 TaxID=1652100 RepID=UPI0009A30AEC|nr:hypothetical protein [Microbispora sp. GKU 823]OPG10565.1 hypothetical protein B1L11_23175 [Microbispora sp. GKU 823]
MPAPDSRPGDLLLAIHSADIGSLNSMAVDGGGTWTAIAARGRDGGAGGTKVYRRTATAAEPSTYQFTQSFSADNTVTILAIPGGSSTGIVITQQGAAGSTQDVTAPAATPSTGSGLELRVGVAFSLNSSTTLSWQTPTGWTPVRSAQSRQYVAATVASRAIVSSTQVAAATFRTSRSVGEQQGFTILIPTTGSTPTPPVIPDTAPGRGSGLYRYMCHDLRTGAYITDIRPSDCTFDRRIGEPGTFSATLPIPNKTVAEEVARIVPRFSSDLSTGPGRFTVRIWRAGVLWGEYWITAAQISRSRRGGISVQLRGSTLDAYLRNVPVESDLSYSSDQIANARSLITHMQGLTGANISLQLQPGTSGVTRPLEVKASDDKTYGDALADFAREYNGFEYVIDPSLNATTGEVERWWRWGYPRIQGTTTHVVTESPHGGDILEWSEQIDALRGATRARVRGGTPEVTDAEAGSEPVYSSWASSATHLAAGWPRIGQRVDHPGQSTSTSELNDYVVRWLAAMAGAVRVYSCTVALGAKTTLSPSALGDQVRRVMVNEWFPSVDGGAGVNQSQRLIGIAISPVRRGVGKEEAQLILEEPTISDLADDRFPTEQNRDIRQLQRNVDRLSNDARTVRGVPVPRGTDLSNPPNFSSPSVQTGDYASASAYTALRADAAALHDTVRDLMNSLRNGGVIT